MHYIRMKTLYETYRYKAKVARTFFRAWVHRQRLGNVCFIGITGSAGKTTTKDFSHLLLSAFYPVSGTLKSLNVALAVAETVLRTDGIVSACWKIRPENPIHLISQCDCSSPKSVY